jgi:hypothetical protein
LLPPKKEEGAAKRQPRKSVLMTGIIAYGAHSFDCTFRDLSESGARITVKRNAQLPPDFYLINIRDRVAYEAQMVWNDGAEIGVTFKKVLPLADITDSSLTFLKRLWLSKATR